MSDENEEPETYQLEYNRRVITWKDADQNLCTVAISMFNEASFALRDGASPQTSTQATESGPGIPPGYLNSNDSSQAWWSWGWNQAAVNNENDTWTTDVAQPASATCWYSFQNMLRMRLAKARQELHDNLFPQKKKLRTDLTITRNIQPKRRGTSKFGRDDERPG